MATQFSIGTGKAFKNGYAYHYTKEEIDGEVVYVCSKGSQWCKPGEFLVLRKKGARWIAWDSLPSYNTLLARQPVFRSDEDITAEGWHTWQTNYSASSDDGQASVEWKGDLSAETRHDEEC